MNSEPVYVGGPSDSARPLRRVDVQTREDRDESWLQALIHERPELLPAHQFDERLTPLISLAREVGVSSGSIDNLFIGPTGQLVVVETKLWKNPEKHRSVVAQVIDYAKELARWDYERLCAEVAASSGVEVESLVRARIGPTFDALKFQERVAANLRNGEFLLLIVGDRLSANVLLLSKAIEGAPSLRFTMGLVELQMFAIGDSDFPLIVVPEVVGRTVERERFIVRVEVEQGTASPRVTVKSVDEATEAEETESKRSASSGVGFSSVESLLSDPELRAELVPIYRAAFDAWKAAGGRIRVSAHNVNLDIETADVRCVCFRADDNGRIAILRAEDFKDLAVDQTILDRYIRGLPVMTPDASSRVTRGKVYLDADRISARDLRQILDATIGLLGEVNAALARVG